MGQFKPKTRDQILTRMINRVVARSSLNDLNNLSDLKQVLAAAAREDDDTYVQMINLLDLFDLFKCRGNDLDERAKEYNPSLVKRLDARKATGTVTFSRTGTIGSVTIAIGTQVTIPADGAQPEVVFTTTTLGTILGGNTVSNAVTVEAADAGASGNAAVGVIKGFVSKPSGVTGVTNPAAFTNGRDREQDDAFLKRIVDQVAGLARCHAAGLEPAALSVEDTNTGKRVLFANVVEDPINLGRVTIYIDDGSGTAETTAVKVEEVVLAVALGGETKLNLPDKPIKIENTFTLRRNTVALVFGVDYTLNPASGQINLLPGTFPTGLTAGDLIDASYTYFTGLIALTQKVIDGDPGDRSNFPGYRGAGVRVRVLTPAIVQIVVRANITVLAGFNQAAVAADVKSAISEYVNGLGISDDVILNEMKERAMAIPGMYDVSFFLPVENRIVQDNQLARLIASNITVS